MTMKNSMENTIKDNIPEATSSRSFDKTKKSTYLSCDKTKKIRRKKKE